MATIRKLYIPRNLTLPEIEKAFLSVNQSLVLMSFKDRLNVVETAVNLTLDESHDVVVGKTNAITITLPAAATYFDTTQAEGKVYHITNDIANVNSITLAAAGAELINDANTWTIPPGSAPSIVTNGTKWIIF